MTPQRLDSIRSLALEFCDESDIRYYEHRQEFHVMIPQEYRAGILERFEHIKLPLIREIKNTRENWDRLVFKTTSHE